MGFELTPPKIKPDSKDNTQGAKGLAHNFAKKGEAPLLQ
tara:strand:+ start:325 stop:441 length:117 start_codon:yes stop_codon:yes gene_type:complete